MKNFMDQDFLLESESARRLFHDFAKNEPIIDFHSHLSPEAVRKNSRFTNIGEVWLGGDHYKWRAMRSAGIPEETITSPGSEKERFLAWARTIPRTIGNPLYHWTHLELQRYFGTTTLLGPDTAEEIWEHCNAVIARDNFTVHGLLDRMKVEILCTTDDPVDTLEHHASHAASGSSIRMFPTFRPDKALALEDIPAWKAYLARLGELAGKAIARYDDLIAALESRHDHFHAHGCRLSDHALIVPFAVRVPTSPQVLFDRAFSGEALTPEERESLQAHILIEIGGMNTRRGWTMQLHMGAIRNLNTRFFKKLGPDTGFDAVSDKPIAENLARLLDGIEQKSGLPKTILYTLNPSVNEVLGTIMGCFQDSAAVGKIQFGSGWWFNDQMDGMQRQMTSLASLGLLSGFVGMLTDSRSFLSFPRHEYFRRILCNMVGSWVEKGQAPADFELLGNMVRDISYRNAKSYFAFPE